MMFRQIITPWPPRLNADYTVRGFRTGVIVDVFDWCVGLQLPGPGFIVQVGPLVIYSTTLANIRNFFSD